MHNATLSTFIIDLKLTPEGQVKILEFGRAWSYSGFTGHDRHSPEKALADKIGGFYKSFGLPIVQIGTPHERFPMITPHHVTNEALHDKRPEKAYAALRKSLGTDLRRKSSESGAVENHSMIVLTDHIFSSHAAKFVQRFEAEGYPALVVDRKPGLLYGCMKNKALLQMLVSQRAPKIFPESEIVTFRARNPVWTVWPQGTVLKVPTTIRGEGVAILPPGRKSLVDMRDAYKDLPDIEKHFMLVTQEVVHGRRVKHPENGQDYDPTIRVAVTAVCSNNTVRLECHDIAYNKFPAEPASDTADPAALKSVSEGASSLVSEFEKAAIFGQLKKYLPRALANVYGDPLTHIRDAFKRADPLAPYLTLALLEDSNFASQDLLAPVLGDYGHQMNSIIAELV